MGEQHHKGHHHDHPHPLASGTQTQRRLILALEINVLFLFVEAIGGWYTNSLALISDAGHMLTDVAALALALVAHWLAARPATTTRTFGYRRAEILAAFLNSLLLWGIVAVVVWTASRRILNPPPVQGALMSVIAFLGLAANAGGAWMLHKEHGNMNVRGAYLHLLSDTLGSLGALGAGAYMMFGGSAVADPIISILIAGLIFWGSIGLMRDSVNILMEATPANVDMAGIQRSLAGLPGVHEVHDLHVWQIGSGLTALTGHLVVGSSIDRDHLLMQAQGVMRTNHGIQHLTLQTETLELHRFLTTEEQTVQLERKNPISPRDS
jgi:cobalt-zinc-cadmium efflux system protein